jgi:predicted ATPase
MSIAKNSISKLTIKGFKSIRDLNQFNLNKLNILIGENGAGKSNFVSYFRMLSEMAKLHLQRWTAIQGSADRIVSGGLKATKKIESFIEFGAHGYKFELEPTVDGEFIFAKEQLSVDGSFKKDKWISLGSGHKESNLREKFKFAKEGDATDCSYGSISNWRVFHFHDTSDTAGMKRLGSVQDNEYLWSDASNLAAYLYRISEESPEVFEQIRKIIRLAIPFFDDFILKPKKLKTEEEQIRLLWKQKDSDYALWPSQLSDGSIRFICLVTALHQLETPSTIIMDEPEIGLHPFAITLLGSLLRSASTRMQVIVATQSVSLINEFTSDDLIILELEEGNTVFRRHEPDNFKVWVENYSLGDIWENKAAKDRVDPINDAKDIKEVKDVKSLGKVAKDLSKPAKDAGAKSRK